MDASFNHLVTLEGLRGLGHLKELDVCWNKLTKAREDIAVLGKHTPALIKLDARYNPWKRVCAVFNIIKYRNFFKLSDINCILSICIEYMLEVVVDIVHTQTGRVYSDPFLSF